MRIDIWKASTLALAGALTFVIATGGNLALAEGQPHMREALETLRVARTQLDKADNDKGGHRAKAIGLVDQALEQVKLGIEFDDTHKNDKKSVDSTDASPEASTP